MATYKAYWTGRWPTLCRGTWRLFKDDKDISDMIPNVFRDQNMKTYGTYRRVSLDRSWNEVTEEYTDGLEADEWINTNLWWLNSITKDPAEQAQIFKAFQEADFRRDSCGGCL